MKKLLLTTAFAATAFAAPATAGLLRAPISPEEAPQTLQAAVQGGFLLARANEDDTPPQDPWGEEAKEWECPIPRPTKAVGDRDPIYKTELFVTYRIGAGIRTFNVRHTAVSGASYDRPDQYAGIRVASSSTRQTWSGYYTKNPRQQIVGELRFTSLAYSEAHGAKIPVKAVYTEKVYKDGRLQTTVVAQCHWTGPAC